MKFGYDTKNPSKYQKPKKGARYFKNGGQVTLILFSVFLILNIAIDGGYIT
jgi:hypothetical protein